MIESKLYGSVNVDQPTLTWYIVHVQYVRGCVTYRAIENIKLVRTHIMARQALIWSDLSFLRALSQRHKFNLTYNA